MSNFVDWAKAELAYMLESKDEIDRSMGKHLLHMVEEFSKEGHSGFSAGFAANCLNKLFRWEPLRPLTGEDNEWEEFVDGKFQNKRCSRVFKDDRGAYDIEGKVFVEPSGASYTRKQSMVRITFPYTPKTEYVKVDKDGVEIP